MRVASLHIYPIKSTAPTDVQSAQVEPWGLAGDRRWLVVDPDGNQMTAREHHQLLQVRAAPRPDGGITLTRPQAHHIELDPRHLGEPTTAAVWKTSFPATDAGDTAADWFSESLGTSARLVYLHDPTARPNTDERARPGDTVSAADSYPLLLTTTASLQQLNEWIRADHGAENAEVIAMQRFRPNVVVDSDDAFAEDGWEEIRIGGATFRGGGPCQRCVMTTIEPATLRSGKEPIRTMARHRRWDGKTWFGLNLTPIATGTEPAATISVGDTVTPTA